MLETYASAALICVASLLVGRAVFAIAGHERWTWLEPAVGFAAMITVAGALSRAPGRSTTAALGLGFLLLGSIVVLLASRPRAGTRPPAEDRPGPRAGATIAEGLPLAILTAAILSIPFAVAGRWGIPGVGFNNDLGLHLAWTEWLRSDLGPTPFAGYPLGPHGLAAATAAVPGIDLGKAFVGEIFAISVITALTALAALSSLAGGRRLLAAAMVAVPYLAASYFAQGTFKETAQALFVLAFAVGLAGIDRRRAAGAPASPLSGRSGRRVAGWARTALPYLALAGGIFFAYSFAGLAWPAAILALWSLTVPEVRRALAPRRLLRFLLRPVTLVTILLVGGIGVVATAVGPFGFASGFNKVAGSNTYGPISPVESFGVWWASNYRLDAPGTADLPWLAGGIGSLALAAGLLWWLRRRETAVPVALAACALLYLVSLPFSGDYSQAKALMIGAPLVMLIAIRPPLAEIGRRIAWTALAVVFIAGAAYSSFLALRDAPIGPPGHGAELSSFLPILHGKPVLYAGQDRYAAYELLGADTHVPLVEFPDEEVSPNLEKPFDTGDAYSPIDFDSFNYGTLERFPYVITGRAAWNSGAPRNFRRIATTPSYVLWERSGSREPGRRVLVEGTDAAAWAGCAAPEIRILLGFEGRASLFPETVIAEKGRWNPRPPLGIGDSTSQRIRLPAGRWRLSLQYFSPFGLTLSAPGFRQEIKAALDGQRPNTISLANNGQFWPAGILESSGGPLRLTIAADEPSTLQRLSGYEGRAYVGNLVATRAEPHRTVPLARACNTWIDWYESPNAP